MKREESLEKRIKDFDDVIERLHKKGKKEKIEKYKEFKILMKKHQEKNERHLTTFDKVNPVNSAMVVHGKVIA